MPVKNLVEAKRRLSHHLSVQDRRALVLAMLEDVLESIQASKAFQEVIVVSSDKHLGPTAVKYGAETIVQSALGLNSGIQQATRRAMDLGAHVTTNVLADIPFIGPDDFTKIVGISAETPRVVLSPSLDGGTNIMLRSPPDAIDHAYGRWSFTRHLRNAQKKGAHVYAVSNPRSSFDVDTIDDLRTILRLDPDGRTRTGIQVRRLESLFQIARNA